MFIFIRLYLHINSYVKLTVCNFPFFKTSECDQCQWVGPRGPLSFIVAISELFKR